jgi:hypothetical protein
MFPIDTASIAGRSSADMTRRNPRRSPLTLVAILALASLATRPRRDALPDQGRERRLIILSAKDIVGTPRWGVRYGDEANALDDTATCLSGDRARNCASHRSATRTARLRPRAARSTLPTTERRRAARGSNAAFLRPKRRRAPVLPADNIWNRDISAMPIHAMSATWIASIGAGAPLHPDFGAGPYQNRTIGIPYAVIGRRSRSCRSRSRIRRERSGSYPIPPLVPVEGGARTRAKERRRARLARAGEHLPAYEVYAAKRLQKGASWDAGSGAVVRPLVERAAPDTWTSADAAGLPILPGLIRYDEILAGEITHAVRFTTSVTQRAYVWPARHYASSQTDPALPPMGIRVRLKRRSTSRASRRRTSHPHRSQEVRHDARRQRRSDVHLGRAGLALGRRRPARAHDAARRAISKWSTCRR